MFVVLLRPLLIGMICALAGIAILAWLIWRDRRKNVEPAEETPANPGGPTPREKWILVGVVTGAGLILGLLLYASMFGVAGYGGVVSEKYSETGRAGDYVLVIDGDQQEVAREVYQTARIGSEIRKPFARPYLIVDGQVFASVVQLWFLGFLGTLLLAAIVAVDILILREPGRPLD